jgi:hypothetical protein
MMNPLLVGVAIAIAGQVPFTPQYPQNGVPNANNALASIAPYEATAQAPNGVPPAPSMPQAPPADG